MAFYTIPSRGPGLPFDTAELKSIEENLILKRKIYKENDIEIKNLKKRKKILIEILKNKTIGYLEAKKIILKSKLEALLGLKIHY